jgi:CRP-like cAMP-binding protein
MYDEGNGVDFSRLFDDAPVDCTAKQELVSLLAQDSEAVFYLVRGYVAEQTVDRFNGITTHAIYGPRDIIIPRVAASNRLAPRRYRAITACYYQAQPAQLFFQRATQTQKYGMELIDKLLYQLQVAHARTENLALKYATDRVAYRLLFFAGRFGVERGHGVEIRLPLTHQLIASTVNLSRERVSQVMYKLSQSGYLSYAGKRVVVHDMEALRQMVFPEVDPHPS